jgi:phage terminase large subunit
MLTDSQIDGAGAKLLTYRPLPAPKGFHRDQSIFRWMFGGNRSGKSEANIGWDLCSFALGIHPWRQTPPNAEIWAIADEWPLVGKLLWKEKIKAYLPASEIRGDPIWLKSSLEIPVQINLVNGNTIEFKAGNQGRTSFEGRAIDAIYQDEQIKRDSEGIFTEIQARLEKPGSFFAGSMTPIQPQLWLSDRIEEGRPHDGIYYANLNDNRRSRGGHVADERVDMMIAEWAPEVQETRIKGYFASFIGAVYKSFNRRYHVCQPFDIPKDWPRYRIIDWGFNNPFACLWMARSPDKIWYVYAEHYKAQQTLAYHAECIKKISGRERYRVTWADHDAQDRFEFKKLGIPTMPAKKDVHLGVEAVQAALKVQGNGKSRLQIFETCKHTRKEMSSYKWAEGTETRDAKDMPLELNDHTCDCVRYGIYGVEHKGYFGELI